MLGSQVCATLPSCIFLLSENSQLQEEKLQGQDTEDTKGTMLPGAPECPSYTNSSKGVGVKVMSQETSSHTKAGKVPGRSSARLEGQAPGTRQEASVAGEC